MGHGHGGHGHHGHHGGGGGRWNDWGFFGFPYPYGYGAFGAPALVAAPALPYRAAALAPYAAGPMLAPNVYGPAPAAVVTGQDAVAIVAPGLGAGGLSAPLGFRSRRVGGHKTRRVVACAETAFQATGLYIPRHVAKHFDIKSIRVGGICLLNERNSIPAEYFSNEGCYGPGPLQFPPILPGQRIEMRVKNHSGSSHRFRAALTGLFIY